MFVYSDGVGSNWSLLIVSIPRHFHRLAFAIVRAPIGAAIYSRPIIHFPDRLFKMPNSTCNPSHPPLTQTSSRPHSAIQSQIVCDALAALRGGQDGIEQFIESLFDELDASWEQLDHDRSWIDARREELKQTQAEAASQRVQWEIDRQQWHDSLQQRVVELERDRLRLQSELESARAGAVELTQAMTDQRRQIAAERAEWSLELRLLRESLDRPAVPVPAAAPRPSRKRSIELREEWSEEPLVEITDERPADPWPEPIVTPPVPQRPSPTSAVARPPAPAIARPAIPGPVVTTDPVLGPLLSQFERLQRDVAKRRIKNNPHS